VEVRVGGFDESGGVRNREKRVGRSALDISGIWFSFR
jgi:hypothetical protein